jgi:type IV secretion system protein TrbL
MQFNTLTLTLQNFIAAFSAGYGRLQGPIESLLRILVGIDVVLLGLWAALGGGESLVGVFKRILHLGIWVWIVQSFPQLAKAFVESLVQAGLLAGGGSGDVSLILDPSRLAGYGLDATQPLAQKLEDLGTFDVADLLVFGLGYVALIVCFFLMAIQVFLAVLEYYLFVACVGILLPFGLLGPTKFLAEKAIGAVVSAGIKLMVLSFITAVIEPVLVGMHFSGPQIALNELWAMLLTIGAITLLCCKAPGLAAGLLAGSPSLGAGGGLWLGAAVGTSAGRALVSAAARPQATTSLQAVRAATSVAGAAATSTMPVQSRSDAGASTRTGASDASGSGRS